MNIKYRYLDLLLGQIQFSPFAFCAHPHHLVRFALFEMIHTYTSMKLFVQQIFTSMHVGNSKCKFIDTGYCTR